MQSLICKPNVFTDSSFTKCPWVHVVISFIQSCVDHLVSSLPGNDWAFRGCPNHDFITCSQLTCLPAKCFQTGVCWASTTPPLSMCMCVCVVRCLAISSSHLPPSRPSLCLNSCPSVWFGPFWSTGFLRVVLFVFLVSFFILNLWTVERKLGEDFSGGNWHQPDTCRPTLSDTLG